MAKVVHPGENVVQTTTPNGFYTTTGATHHIRVGSYSDSGSASTRPTTGQLWPRGDKEVGQ